MNILNPITYVRERGLHFYEEAKQHPLATGALILGSISAYTPISSFLQVAADRVEPMSLTGLEVIAISSSAVISVATCLTLISKLALAGHQQQQMNQALRDEIAALRDAVEMQHGILAELANAEEDRTEY